jgi:hypothetical protein
MLSVVRYSSRLQILRPEMRGFGQRRPAGNNHCAAIHY